MGRTVVSPSPSYTTSIQSRLSQDDDIPAFDDSDGCGFIDLLLVDNNDFPLRDQFPIGKQQHLVMSGHRKRDVPKMNRAAKRLQGIWKAGHDGHAANDIQRVEPFQYQFQ